MSLICPKCNTTNVNEARFCKNCGADIAEELKKRYEKEEAKKELKVAEEIKIDSYHRDASENKNFGLFLAGFLIIIVIIAILRFNDFN